MKIASDHTFDHVLLPPDRQIPWHSQDSWEFSYVVRGCGRCHIGQESFGFVSGSMMFIPPGVRHCWQFDPHETDDEGNIENITLLFERTFVDRVTEAFPELSEKLNSLISCTDAVLIPPPVSSGISGILGRMLSEDMAARTLSFLSALLQLSAYIGSDAGKHIPVADSGTGLYGMRLDRIRTYVSCNYSRRISISDMAKYAGMNRSAFCRFFRKHTGKTFISYLNEFRIQKAAFLLENEGCSVSEACYASGFNDISYFSRKFRSITGRTPSSLLD